MKTLLSFGNAKLLKDNIATFGLPAGECCPFAGECRKWCYASKGRYKFKVVAAKRQYNLACSMEEPFVEAMCDEIQGFHVEYVRIHDSGDFYSKEYLNKWIEIAKASPKVLFYTYTKSFPLFEGVELPSNFIVIGSEGGLYPVPSKYPVAKVFDKAEDVPLGWYVGNESDAGVIGHIQGGGKQIALIKH